MFNLKTNVEELSSVNQGIAKKKYEQHAPTRDVTGTNFPNGNISIKFQSSGQKWWCPKESYVRFRVALSQQDGTQLSSANDIAPAMGLCANLFQSMEFRINDKTVSRIADFVPQIDALHNRLYRSRSWLKSLGSALNTWDVDFDARKSIVTSDNVLIQDVTGANRPQSEPFTRADLGLDAAGGAGNDRNAATYTAASGNVVFSQNGGAALPADIRPLYPIGSYFEFTTIQGATATDARVKKPAKVVAHISATTIQLETGVIVADVVADGRTDFIRVDYTPIDGSDTARKVREFEVLWIPPLNIFDVDHCMPSGKYELVLTPQTSSVYQKYAIESKSADKVPNSATTAAPSAGSNFLFQVQDMYLYTSTIEGPRADDVTYLLDLTQITCNSDQFSANQTGFQQKNFDVSPSTVALSVAYQDSRSGNDTRNSSSLFKVSNTASTTDNEEQKLTRLYVQYAGQQLPQPDADPEFKSGVDRTTQRYLETQLSSGGYHDSGGAESLYEWQKRGSVYHWIWPRDGTDRSTRVTVHNEFSGDGGADTANMRLLLFSHSKQVARIAVEQGNVTSVEVEDA